MSIIPQTSKNYVGFDPRTIPGCSLWLDAADVSTITLTSEIVTSVLDKSGKGYHLTGGSGFTYNQTKFNSVYPSFYNDSNTSSVIGTNTSFSLSQPLTAFAVGQSLAPSGAFPIIMDSAPGGSSRISFYYWNSGGLRVRLFANSEIEYIGAASTFINSYYANTTSSQIFVNGSSVVSGNIGNGFLSRLIVGNGVSTTNAFIGHLCEILIFNSVLSTAQRQQVEGYLANKWGLRSNLPASHPYRTIPIFTRPFQPTDITGCSLWLDAADRSTITLSGSNVTQWNDKSTTATNATPSNGSVTLSSSNGYTGVYVNNNGSSLSPGTALFINSNFLTSSSFTVYAVYHFPETLGYVTIFSDARAATDETRIQIGETQVFDVLTNGTLRSNSVSLGTGRQFICVTADSSALTVYKNGTNIAQNSTTGTTYSSDAGSLPAIGGPSLNGTSDRRFATGWFFEVLIFNSVLSTAQRQQVESYLASKWGLRGNLPSTHPFKLFPALTPLFTPLQISNCQVWLDAADASTVTLSGSNVTGWRDKSGNGKNAGTTSNYPTYSSGTIRFNGSSGTANYLDIPSFDFGTSTRTAFFVMRNTSSSTGAGSQANWFWPNTGNSTNALSIVWWVVIALQGTTFNIVYNTVTKNEYVIVGFRFGVTSGFQELFINGTRVGTSTKSDGGTSYANATSGYRLGSPNPTGTNTGEYFDGNIAEIILMNVAVGDYQRQQIEGYLANKWGLKNSLPSTHPFKTISP